MVSKPQITALTHTLNKGTYYFIKQISMVSTWDNSLYKYIKQAWRSIKNALNQVSPSRIFNTLNYITYTMGALNFRLIWPKCFASNVGPTMGPTLAPLLAIVGIVFFKYQQHIWLLGVRVAEWAYGLATCSNGSCQCQFERSSRLRLWGSRLHAVVQSCLKAIVSAGLYPPVHIKDIGDLIEMSRKEFLVIVSSVWVCHWQTEC